MKRPTVLLFYFDPSIKWVMPPTLYLQELFTLTIHVFVFTSDHLNSLVLLPVDVLVPDERPGPRLEVDDINWKERSRPTSHSRRHVTTPIRRMLRPCRGS